MHFNTHCKGNSSFVRHHILHNGNVYLTGAIVAEIGELENLQELFLHDNQLRGEC